MSSELERLQGNWNIVDLEMEGQKMPSMGGKISVKGDRFISSGMGETYEGKIVVDTTQNPKHINLVFDKGPEKGNTALGIFHIEDDDTWKICLTTQGTNRPQLFATKAGTGHACEVLKREGSPGAEGSKASQSGQGVPEIAPSEPGHLAPLQGEWAMVSGSMDGQPFDKSMIKAGKRTTKANETTVHFGGQVYMKAKFRVDPTTSPKTIDYVITEGANQGQTLFGIYETDGKTLKVVSAAPGKERPSDFSSTPGDGKTFTTWKLITP